MKCAHEGQVESESTSAAVGRATRREARLGPAGAGRGPGGAARVNSVAERPADGRRPRAGYVSTKAAARAGAPTHALRELKVATPETMAELASFLAEELHGWLRGPDSAAAQAQARDSARPDLTRVNLHRRARTGADA